MEIRNRSNGELTTASQFKASQPNTTFPKQITTEVLDSYGYDAVLNGAAATVTAPQGVSTRSGVEEVSGQWFTKFVVGPVFTDTKDEDGNTVTAATNEAAYKAKVDADAASNIRSQRDTKLADCDWTQTNDSPVKDESTWTFYRQALRDLPSTQGFPHDISWPDKPTAQLLPL